MADIWTPRPDQRVARDWLAGRQRGALWLPTGAGKTVLTATWLDEVLLDRFAAGKVLIVAPPLVVPGWVAQLRKWAHLAGLAGEVGVVTNEMIDATPVVRASGARGELEFRNKRDAKRALLALGGRVHLCTWWQFPWVEKALGRNWPYEVLVLDESTKVRDRESAAGRAARRAVHKSGRVTHLLELTATPRANHDEAVFAQLDLVELGCFAGTLTEFREQWCVPASVDKSSGRVYAWKVAVSRRPEFEAVCSRLALSLPEALGIDVIEVEHPIVLSSAAEATYDALKRTQVLPGVTAASAAVLHAKLRQICAGWVYADDGTAQCVHIAKPERFAELVEQIDRQVVAAYQWKFEDGWLRRTMGKHYGNIKDPGALDAFMAGKLQVLGLHPGSAGHGLDGLQARSNNLIWTSVPEDVELYTQTNGRLKRPGQDSPTVFVHALVAQDAREQEIWREVLPGKVTLQDVILRAARKDEA